MLIDGLYDGPCTCIEAPGAIDCGCGKHGLAAAAGGLVHFNGRHWSAVCAFEALLSIRMQLLGKAGALSDILDVIEDTNKERLAARRAARKRR